MQKLLNNTLTAINALVANNTEEFKLPAYVVLADVKRRNEENERLYSEQQLLAGEALLAGIEDVNANDAKEKMRLWVGQEPRFHPHVALHDFEAWLLPYWTSIQQLARHNKTAPTGKPETVNHTNPPAYRIKEIFEIGRSRDSYVKPRDAGRILSKNDLGVAVAECPELKAFVNTIISVCGGKIL